jgi:SAM-dependent methyltransferase
MGLEREDLRTLLDVLPQLERRESLLVLGDAVVHCDGPGLVGLAEEQGYAIAPPPDRLDAESLGTALGFARTETFDVGGDVSIRGNLHDPPPPELTGAFDCVVDAGVLFWCSDPGAALRTILQMARPGALITHVTAVSGHYGRGYWDVHPRLLEDFYLRNGCEFVVSTARTKFRPRRLHERVAARFGRRENAITVSREPGRVFLADSAPNRLGFSDRLAEGGEPNMIPNNVVGVFVGRKLRDVEISMPVPMEAS